MAIFGIEQNGIADTIEGDVRKALGFKWYSDKRTELRDPDAARDLLREFVGAIDDNTTQRGAPYRHPSTAIIGSRIDERILRYLATCFREILSGEDANKALGLSTGQAHRQASEKTRQRNLELAVYVERQVRSGSSVKAAYLSTLEWYNAGREASELRRKVTVDTVKKAHVENREIAAIAAEMVLRLKGN